MTQHLLFATARRNGLAALAAWVLPVAAQAADAAPETAARVLSTFGNTVMSVYRDGRSQKVWMEPDGHWTGLSRRGNALAGTWSIKGEKVCLRQSSPPTLPISFCQTFPADPVKGIDSRDLTGAPIHIKLMRGHVEQTDG